MKSTIVYLIRHSEQLAIDTERIKNEEIPLSENGVILAKKLSELEELQNIDAVFSSNYLRARLTAEYIARRNGIEMIVDERIRRA